ncbi:hypothetical protein SUDANB106_04466 [Streptomyces sp. enrichment culture]
MSDAHAATAPQPTTKPVTDRRAGGEANREAVSDAHAATAPHATTGPHRRRAGGEAHKEAP